MANELLHVTYESLTKVKEEVIIKYNSLNKLKNVVLKIIKSLFYKKNRPKSELFETSQSKDIGDIFTNDSEETENPDIITMCETENSSEKENTIQKMEKKIAEDQKKPDKWFDTTIFLQAQEESINSISKRTKINRSYLTKSYNNAQEDLKNHLRK